MRCWTGLAGLTALAGLMVGCGDPGTEIVLQDGTVIRPEFVMDQHGRWETVETTLPGKASAAKRSERQTRQAQAVQTKAQESCGIRYAFTVVPNDELNYSRVVMSLTNVTHSPIGIDRIVAFSMPVAAGMQLSISGNTDGSVIVAELPNGACEYLAVEHPMAKLSVGRPDAKFTWTAQDVAKGTWEFPVVTQSGDLTLTFQYTGGNHRTDLAKVELVGTAIADEHPGFTGGKASQNVYTLKGVPAGKQTVRVTFGYEGNNRTPNTRGEVALGGTAFSGEQMIRGIIPIADSIGPGETWSYAVVYGEVKEKSQLRRAFQAYLEEERAHPYRVFPHYNSWYDVCINRNDAPWDKRMNEAECLASMQAFRTALGARGVHIDSYLWDDGWDNWDSLWDFHPGFPNGFKALADEAHKDGASISAWLSPCGGYGGSHAARVRYAKQAGILEPNEGLMRLSRPKYYAAFRDRCVDMIKQYDMNMFKFDRMGSGSDATGASAQHAADLRAVVKLIEELRAAKQDVFINATVGTWASPFWVMWADSIWRGGNDWEGLGPGPQRERWITYRDNKIYDRFAVPCPLFPLNSMMMHGIIVGKKGPPACMDRSDSPASTRAFANEVWMGVACGTGLQEYYITPSLMHPQWWDILADGIKWLRANEATLRDAHWVLGDPQGPGNTYNIYGYAALGKGKGIAILRNPSDKPQSVTVSPDGLLEMPKVNCGAPVRAQKVVYTSDPEAAVPTFAATDEAREIALEPFGVRLIEWEF